VTVFLLMGKQGLRELAERNVKKSHFAREELLRQPGCRASFTGPFFNEFVIECDDARARWNNMKEQGLIAGVLLEDWYPELKNCLLLCVTELHTREQIERLAKEFARNT
jgi:glycine dehydrogenase subunit 1